MTRLSVLNRDAVWRLSESENSNVTSLPAFPGFDCVAAGSVAWLASGIGLQHNESASLDQPLGGVSFVS